VNSHSHTPAEFRPCLGEHPTIDPTDVHLWLADLACVSEPRRACLSAGEWLQASRLSSSSERCRYTAARATLRHILAQYLTCDAASLQFTRDEDSRTESIADDPTFRFDYCWSDDWMLLAVTRHRRVGVDLEPIRTNLNFDILAEHFFSFEDQWRLRTAPSDRRRQTFLELWTRNEAQLKAGGSREIGPQESGDSRACSLLTVEAIPGYTAGLAIEGDSFHLKCWLASTWNVLA
jgi:4'-phosphopantetheinyl transferase